MQPSRSPTQETIKELLDLLKDVAKFAPYSLEQKIQRAIAKAEGKEISNA